MCGTEDTNGDFTTVGDCLEISKCWDWRGSSDSIPKIFLAFMTVELARRRAWTVFCECVSKPSSMASSLGLEAFMLLRASMSDMLAGQWLEELLSNSSCFPELGDEGLRGRRKVGLRYARNEEKKKKKCLEQPTFESQAVDLSKKSDDGELNQVADISASAWELCAAFRLIDPANRRSWRRSRDKAAGCLLEVIMNEKQSSSRSQIDVFSSTTSLYHSCSYIASMKSSSGYH